MHASLLSRHYSVIHSDHTSGATYFQEKLERYYTASYRMGILKIWVVKFLTGTHICTSQAERVKVTEPLFKPYWNTKHVKG
uniref:Uncharacterized protein n=1 Tax=Octopus bimaculoides TaxID=37653 RepID=A0A0L8FWD0_OCTBM